MSYWLLLASLVTLTKKAIFFKHGAAWSNWEAVLPDMCGKKRVLKGLRSTANLRPSNILVAVEGPAWSVKLADFGIPANVDDPWPPKNYIRKPPFHKLDDMLEYCAGIRKFPTSPLRASTRLSIDFILRAMNPVPDKRMSILQVLNHEWLRVNDSAQDADGRCWRCTTQKSLDNVRWKMSTASMLHNRVAKPSKLSHSLKKMIIGKRGFN
ncbi:hypothetical protein B0T09DRAFT_374721 [Sordaria sp. MPI-SDFR-AT-0083]|nr:hypothetical protein B0T09DRAFT_374721 [Sordaria sp. MPI-SDFR-AT-0083]